MFTRIFLLLSIFIVSLLSTTIWAFALDKNNIEDLNLQQGAQQNRNVSDATSKVDALKNDAAGASSFSYFNINEYGEKWAQSLMIRIARDMKNIIILVAIFYLVFSVFRILFNGGGDEDIKKWKLTILWTTFGIILMQSAFALTEIINNENVTGSLALNIGEKIIMPFIRLIQMVASFAFLAMAIYAFYRIITSWGDEEGAKAGKRTVIYAVVGFALLKFPELIIKTIYGEAECSVFGCTITNPDPRGFVGVFASAINYVNGFLTLVVLFLVLYAWFLVLTGAGDDEKMKRAKNIIIYAIIGVVLIVSSYMIFNLFLMKG